MDSNLTQAKGQVFGIGCKVFTIAKSVILYRIFTSWALGLIYWTGKMIGVFCTEIDRGKNMKPRWLQKEFRERRFADMDLRSRERRC